MDYPIIIGPIDEIARARNAVMGARSGWRVVTRFAPPADELHAAQERVALADESANGKLLLEAMDADAVLKEAYGIAVTEVGASAAIEHGFVYRLRRDLYFISTFPEGERAAAGRIDAATRALHLLPGMSQDSGAHEQGTGLAHPSANMNSDGAGGEGQGGAFVTLTDVTHGNAELRIVGPQSRALLSKLCGLDFHPRAFPNGCAKQSSFAKTVQIIVRRDIGELPAYAVIGARSLGAYAWETILHAGEEFGIEPVGEECLRGLESVMQSV
jgi:glycine cleavage system aminomethyltransferase T